MSRFRVTGHFEKCTKWPQNNLEHYKVKLPDICITSVPDSKFHSVSLYDQPFSRYRPFWDKCTEWPQIDLEPHKVKLPYICITSVRDSQILVRFALWPALFEIQAILRQVHRMTPNWPWTLLGQRYTTYVLLVSPSPKFCSVLLYDQRFPWYRTFYNSPLHSLPC